MSKFAKKYLMFLAPWFFLFEFVIWVGVEEVQLHPFLLGNILFLTFAGGLALLFVGIYGFIEGKFSRRGY